MIAEKIDQGPEGFYLKENLNGLWYEKDNIKDLKKKIEHIMNESNYENYKHNTKIIEKRHQSKICQLNSSMR